MPNVHRTRRTRRESIYTAAERRILKTYKEEYRQLPSADERASLFKSKILVDLFNHWVSQGKEPGNDLDSAAAIKTLWAWVKNNWRPYRTVKKGSVGLKVTLRQVLQRTKQDEIRKEIQKIVGLGDELPSSKESFLHHNTALSAVMERMNAEERKELELVAKEWSNQGYPEEHRRQIADKTGFQKVEQADRLRWLEMGMVSFTLVGWTNAQGTLTIRAHDSMVENMGLTECDTFANKCGSTFFTDLKRKFLEYVAALHRVNTPDAFPQLAKTMNVQPELHLTQDADDLPLLPELLSGGYTPLKVELEALMRTYLNTHYMLASGRTKQHTPWSAVEANISAFISAEYLPYDHQLEDPRNMTGENIKKCLDYWLSRQKLHGAAGAFRWSTYLNSKKEKLPAEYGRRADVEEVAAAAAGRKQSRARARKKKQVSDVDPAIDPSLLELLPMPQRTDNEPTGAHVQPSGPSSNQALTRSSAEEDEPPGVLQMMSQAAPTPHASATPHVIFESQSSLIPISNSDPIHGLASPTSHPIANIDPSLNGHTQNSQDQSLPNLTNDYHLQMSSQGWSTIQGILVPSGWTVVDEHIMDLLRAKGISQQEPANGPNDGPPKYRVPISIVNSLQNNVDIRPPPPQADLLTADTSTTTPKQSRKQSKRLDRTLEEAMKFTGDKSLLNGNGRRQPISSRRVNTRASGRTPRHKR